MEIIAQWQKVSKATHVWFAHFRDYLKQQVVAALMRRIHV